MSMTPVGSTARWVAANRALETASATPLFTDAYARELAGEPGFAMLTAVRSAISGATFTGPDPYLSIRTRFFDDRMLSAVRESSLRQAVILAAGMDARAFRLDWPSDLVLYEVDRDEVFDHKEAVLARLDAAPRCDRRIVRADLGGEWAATLVAAGFDVSRPAAILVEGLLYYLDARAAVDVLETIGRLTSEGSWIGIDLVNPQLLSSPYFATYLTKLRELGCPWTFGVDEPDAFLAEHGWKTRVLTPGEPGANYERWPYPVASRSLAGAPRTYLVEGWKARAGETIERPDVAFDPPPAPTPLRYRSIRKPHLVGSFGCSDTPDQLPGVLALGGSDGGLPEYFLDLLVPEGFACLAVAYFGIEGTQRTLVEVPLERIERALRWLAAHPRVAAPDGRVALVGASRGGELALLVAATFPDLVGPVVAYTPSGVVWPGIDYATTAGPPRSSWTHRGRPLPFMSYVPGVAPQVSERGISVRAVCERALDVAASVEQAAIAVERATGPLLLISGGDDQVWPAARMCGMIVDRMRDHGRAPDVEHLSYSEAGHMLFPYALPAGVSPRPAIRFDYGGSAAAGAAAHAASWPRVLAHLRGRTAEAGVPV
jgi:methyltransferase (TIGR00027 family)